MKLIDVNPAIQAMFHLARPDGVMVLDAGADSRRLKIGKLQRGDQFWCVGDEDEDVKNFDNFKSRLLAAAKSGGEGIRVVYIFSRSNSTGTNTQYMVLGDADIAELSH